MGDAEKRLYRVRALELKIVAATIELIEVGQKQRLGERRGGNAETSAHMV